MSRVRPEQHQGLKDSMLQDSAFQTQLSCKIPPFARMGLLGGFPRLISRARGNAWGRSKTWRRPGSLLLIHEVTAAVLLPAFFIGLGAERLLLAIADGLDAVGANATLHQSISHRIGAVIA